MHELSETFTLLEDLSPTLSRHVNRTLASPDPIAGAEAALLSAARISHGSDPIVAEAVRRITLACGATDLAALAPELGVSMRQLERRFRAGVGVAPKAVLPHAAL